MKYTYELKQNHTLQENSQSILPLKCLVQDLCPVIETKYGTEKYDYSQLLLDKSIWDCYHTSESSVNEMTLDTN